MADDEKAVNKLYALTFNLHLIFYEIVYHLKETASRGQEWIDRSRMICGLWRAFDIFIV